MASSPKFRRQESALDTVISLIRKTYLGKCVDEDFLYDLKVLLETNEDFSIVENNDVASKSLSASTKQTQDLEIECLPDEVLVKIFEYLDLRDISRCAQVSKQMNRISQDSSVWKSREKLSIYDKKVPTEFLTYVLSKGIKALSLSGCKILPPKSSFYENLNLKALEVDNCEGDELIVTRILESSPMEELDLRSKGDIAPLCSGSSKHNYQITQIKLFV